MNPNEKPTNKWVAILPVVALVIAAVSFVGGMQVGKSSAKTSTSTAAAAGRAGGYGGFGGRNGGERPTFGTVASVNGSTLTVTDSQSGGTLTVDITSTTTITDSTGATATASAITTGTTVAVSGTTSGSTITATRIRLNPTMGGFGGGTAPSSDTSGTSGT